LPIKLLIESAQKLSRKPRVIFASTATVYGLTSKSPVFETLKAKPVTTYDLHKHSAENELILASSKNIINAISLRFSNVFGPSLNEAMEADRGILSQVVKMALIGKPITIYGAGNFVRDYVFIKDVIDAIIQVSIIKRPHNIYNVGSGVGTTIEKVFNLIAIEVQRQTGRKVDIQNVEWPKGLHKIEKRNFTASIDLIISDTDWRPKISIEKGIELLIKHYIDEKSS